MKNRSGPERQDVIFLDEIQECSDARIAIKFLVEDGSYDYIESGSLLVGYDNVYRIRIGSLRAFFNFVNFNLKVSIRTKNNFFYWK